MKSWKALTVVLCLIIFTTLTRWATASTADFANRRPFALRPRTSTTPPQMEARDIPRGGKEFHYSYSKGLSIQFIKRPSHEFWWIFPFVVLITAYSTFPALSQAFHRLVLWVSDDSWLPDTAEKMNLLSNVGECRCVTVCPLSVMFPRCRITCGLSCSLPLP